MAFRANNNVYCHGAVVGEGTLALGARFAAFAARVESRFQVSSALSELRGGLVLCAGGASVGPRFRCAVVTQVLAFRVDAQVADLQRFLARAARAEAVLLLQVAR